MNAIPLTTLDALIWKTCRVKLNERELRALVLLLISLVNIAFALIDICLQVFKAQYVHKTINFKCLITSLYWYRPNLAEQKPIKDTGPHVSI